MANLKILTGAALGTLLGSLAIMLYPRRQEIMDAIVDQSEDISDTAKEYIGALIDKGAVLVNLRREEEHNIDWKSGVAGLLLGVGAALILAPKSGKQLRSQIQRMYSDISDRTHDVIRDFKNNGHPFGRRALVRPAKKSTRLIKEKR